MSSEPYLEYLRDAALDEIDVPVTLKAIDPAILDDDPAEYEHYDDDGLGYDIVRDDDRNKECQTW